MTFKHRTGGLATILAGASLTAVIAANDCKTVASAHRDILLETTQSWNGKPYTHYPTGQPQLTYHPDDHRTAYSVYVLQVPSRCGTRPAA